jgi:hypothetical protein
MSDNVIAESSGSEVTRTDEIKFASAFVTPFAAAVAVELEELGLTKQKIDEIIMRSAKRFGEMTGEEPRGLLQPELDRRNQSATYFGWARNASSSTLDFLASVVGKHGPNLIEKLAPVVTTALEQALSNYLRGMTATDGAIKSKSTPKKRL